MQLAAAQPKLLALGVETVAIVNTFLGRARLYFRYRPSPAVLLVDPDAAAHAAFGVPKIEFVAGPAGDVGWPWRASREAFGALRINPMGELPEPMPFPAAAAALNRKDGFEVTADDQQVAAAHGSLLLGHFLIDRDGVIRWTHVEAKDRPEDLTKFPGESDLLAAARSLGG